MPLTLNKRIWIFTERVYIHAHSYQEFLELLQKHEIEYLGEPYEEFERTYKGIYVFMSEENFSFADFMGEVPSYKYLPLLTDIVFDENVQKTTGDGWNYYGENVNKWRPSIVELLTLAEVEVHETAQELIYNEPERTTPTGEFVAYDFADPFLDNLRNEINSAHENELYKNGVGLDFLTF